MSDIVDFITNYDSSHESRICFNLDGTHNDDFIEINVEFRALVLEKVLADISSVSIVLIRDLFRAETRYSRLTQGIVDGVGELAESLLRRGGIDYLDNYLEGKFQSFDASCGSVFEYDLPLAETMLEEVRNRLDFYPDSPQVTLWHCGEDLFLSWVADCKKRPA
jgi:hypothetical protein